MSQRRQHMIAWGINALNHGSSLTLFDNGDFIAYYSDKEERLPAWIFTRSIEYGEPAEIYWYERPWIKKARQLKAGQYSTAFDMSVIPKRYLDSHGLHNAKLKYTPHHASHAAAGYYTSPFDHCAVVVLDAIGEFECATIWEGRGENLVKKWHRSYPNSLGLFYSAFTKLIGYEPILEEYRLQEDSLLGDSNRYYDDIRVYFSDTVEITENFHRGVRSWPHEIVCQQDRYDIAAAVQRVFEEQVDRVMMLAKDITASDNLVYMGGCAMNSLYNKRLNQRWKGIWSLPNPGDPSSSLGAVLYHTRKKIDVKFGIVKHLEISV